VGVEFSWNGSDGTSVAFSVVDAGGATLSNPSGPSGNATFLAYGGKYEFESCSWRHGAVIVQATHAGPALP
jgi:hypothetical protein